LTVRPLLAISTPVNCLRIHSSRLPSTAPHRPLPLCLLRQLHATTLWRNQEAFAVAEEVDEELPSSSGGPATKFHELADRQMVSRTVVDTLVKDMKLETMTEVQAMTINETLKGVDVYVTPSCCTVPVR